MNQTTATTSKNTIIERLDVIYEFNRGPISKKKFHGWKTVIAMAAGVVIILTACISPVNAKSKKQWINFN